MWRTGQGDAVEDELKVGAAQANTKGQAASILRVVVPQLSRTSRPRLRLAASTARWRATASSVRWATSRGLRSVFLRAASVRSRAMDSSSRSAGYQPNSAASSARRRLSWSLVGAYSSSALGVAAQLGTPGETPRIMQRDRAAARPDVQRCEPWVPLASSRSLHARVRFFVVRRSGPRTGEDEPWCREVVVLAQYEGAQRDRASSTGRGGSVRRDRVHRTDRRAVFARSRRRAHWACHRSV